MEITNSVALVTGANRGLGSAFVDALLARGARKVYAAARRPEEVVVADPRVVPIRLDVTDPEQVAAAAAIAGDVTLLINNAGTVHGGPLLEPAAVATLDAEFAVNVYGTLAMATAFAPLLAANGGGAVVNMCSVLSFVSIPGSGGYSAAKAAEWSITNGIRLELAPQGTQVVAVHVGYIDTDMAADVDAPKLRPEAVAGDVLEGVEAGAIEVLVDDLTRSVRQGLAGDLRDLYASLAA
jgi:NAD(P)-dependent dehydrogenase (short-subunit alcohol dehydrogenase family)